MYNMLLRDDPDVFTAVPVPTESVPSTQAVTSAAVSPEPESFREAASPNLERATFQPLPEESDVSSIDEGAVSEAVKSEISSFVDQIDEQLEGSSESEIQEAISESIVDDEATSEYSDDFEDDSETHDSSDENINQDLQARRTVPLVVDLPDTVESASASEVEAVSEDIADSGNDSDSTVQASQSDPELRDATPTGPSDQECDTVTDLLAEDLVDDTSRSLAPLLQGTEEVEVPTPQSPTPPSPTPQQNLHLNPPDTSPRPISPPPRALTSPPSARNADEHHVLSPRSPETPNQTEITPRIRRTGLQEYPAIVGEDVDTSPDSVQLLGRSVSASTRVSLTCEQLVDIFVKKGLSHTSLPLTQDEAASALQGAALL